MQAGARRVANAHLFDDGADLPPAGHEESPPSAPKKLLPLPKSENQAPDWPDFVNGIPAILSRPLAATIRRRFHSDFRQPRQEVSFTEPEEADS